MAIAKGTITLNNLTDSVTVLVSPSSCVISTDFDGGNTDLSNAYADVSVMRGNSLVGFTLSFASSSNQGIGYSIANTDSYHKRIAITSLPNDIVSGALVFDLVTQDGYSTQVNFQFAVVRESSMFDWIQDWENNKTTIGSTYLITPKIFVGHRTASGTGLGTLSGVYIGPDDANIGTVGMYGLHEGEEIFRINKDGGVIGGWTIGTEYLYSSHVLLGADTSYVGVSPSALTEAIVTANGFSHRDVVHDEGGVAMFYNSSSDYGLEGYLPKVVNNGTTTYRKTFSLGHVNLIAGWSFDTDSIWIGTKSNTSNSLTSTSSSITIGTNGIRGYKWRLESNGVAVFAGGAVSFAANGSGYVANQNLSWTTTGAVTACGGKVVFNTDGSGHVADGNLSWSTSGAISACNGKVVFNTDGSGHVADGNLSWSVAGAITACNGKVAFNTDGSGYVANQNITWDSSGNIVFAGSSMELTGAIYVKDGRNSIKAGMLATGSGSSGIRFFAGASTPASAPFRVDETGLLYASNANITGSISSTSGTIGGWTIDADSIFKGTKATTGFTGSSGSITIGSTGIRGYKWRIESNGVAAFANGNVLFNADGSGNVANGLVSWTTNGTLTIGGSNGTTLQNDMVLTGGIKVKKNGVVKAGMLADGSGSSGIRFFAGSSTPSSAPFRVDEDGVLTSTNAVISGQITASSGYIGNWIINTAANGGTIVSDNSGTPKVTLDASGSIRLYINSMEACIEHMICGGEGYSRGIGSEIKLDADLGIIKIRTVGDVSGGIGSVLLTPTGIYADRAGMLAPSSDDTYSQRAAIVGDGKSTLVATSHNNGSDENCIIGVYGSATNTRASSPAPCYGGFFEGLKMRGLYLGRKVITSTGSHQLDGKDTLVIALPQVNGAPANIYLPTEGAHEGRTIIVKLLNMGEAVVYPGSGSYLNSTSNTNGIMLANGETWVFILVKIPVTTSGGSSAGDSSGDERESGSGTELSGSTTTYYNVWTSMKASQQ